MSKKPFIPLAGTYVLGTLNDNLFKQAALIMAVTSGMGWIQGWATSLFAAPFILFSAWAGWICDRFPKHAVVKSSKGIEVAAMAAGAAGLITGSWWLVMTMVFAMGAQSALFGPALNGAIPELYRTEEINRVGGLLKAATTIGILVGFGSAGLILDSFGPAGVAVSCLLVAVAGLAFSLPLAGTRVPDTRSPFPKSGPLASVAHVKDTLADPELALALICDMAFYSVAGVGILSVNTVCLTVLGMSPTGTSVMSVVMMAGICLGSVAAGRLTTPDRWRRGTAPCLAVLVLAMGGCAFAGSPAVLGAILLAGGAAGGALVIPAAGFIQYRPKPERKGKVIAASNFLSFIGIFLAGPVFSAALAVSPKAAALSVAGIGAVFLIVCVPLSIKAAKAAKNSKDR